jgi:hypothetical protein
MMNTCEEILQIINQPGNPELGGAHNQKGVEFQRHWGILRMFELAEAGVDDFLLLFEAMQDVVELDSSTDPKIVRLYQVKKREGKGGCWTWNLLTGLPDPRKKRRSKKKSQSDLSESLKASPIGKLYSSVVAVKTAHSEGHFISNAVCDLSLNDGSNVSDTAKCSLSMLKTILADTLTNELCIANGNGIATPELSRLHIQHSSLSVNDPSNHLVGIAAGFLAKRSPRHAGQASSLIHGLVAVVSRISIKTYTYGSFKELCQEKGYSYQQFQSALEALEGIPDLQSMADQWFHRLENEGMDLIDGIALRKELSRIHTHQLLGRRTDQHESLDRDCDEWLEYNTIVTPLLPIFESAFAFLHKRYPRLSRAEILAHFTLRAMHHAWTRTRP